MRGGFVDDAPNIATATAESEQADMNDILFHLYRLDVFLHDIKFTTAAVRSPVLAFRFLDYPSFFIHPAELAGQLTPQISFKIMTGKSCMFMETEKQLCSLLSEVRGHVP